MSREYTGALIEMADEGVCSWESLARDLLNWMSEADVEEFAIAQGYMDSGDEDDEDDLDLDEEADALDDFNYVGSRYHY